MLSPEEALDRRRRNAPPRGAREEEMGEPGFPAYTAYTTSVGWLGYSYAKLRRLCCEGIARGFPHFKIKLGASVERRRRHPQDTDRP
ncbi:hypothetical protein [Sorangium cellulosum]|uniref:hypothetical protein n=1 Tax=Sorangium cellulosum TaxID=56 RepID=UPI0013ED119E|nr:hypothetical protein [Sorangium cellulosum]